MLLPHLFQASLNLLFFLSESLSQCSGSQLQLSNPHLFCHTGPAAGRSEAGSGRNTRYPVCIYMTYKVKQDNLMLHYNNHKNRLLLYRATFIIEVQIYW